MAHISSFYRGPPHSQHIYSCIPSIGYRSPRRRFFPVHIWPPTRDSISTPFFLGYRSENWPCPRHLVCPQIARKASHHITTTGKPIYIYISIRTFAVPTQFNWCTKLCCHISPFHWHASLYACISEFSPRVKRKQDMSYTQTPDIQPILFIQTDVPCRNSRCLARRRLLHDTDLYRDADGSPFMPQPFLDRKAIFS